MVWRQDHLSVCRLDGRASDDGERSKLRIKSKTRHVCAVNCNCGRDANRFRPALPVAKTAELFDDAWTPNIAAKAHDASRRQLLQYHPTIGVTALLGNGRCCGTVRVCVGIELRWPCWNCWRKESWLRWRKYGGWTKANAARTGHRRRYQQLASPVRTP